MLSFITSHNPYCNLTRSFTPSLISLHNINTRPLSKSCSFGLKEINKRVQLGCSWCKQGEGDVELETEIMKFMEKSDKPTIFPSKRDLVKARRMDLVVAIQRKGGWFSLGWDDTEGDGPDGEGGVMDSDIEEFQRRVVGCEETASLREEGDNFHGELNGSSASSVSGSDSEDSNSSSFEPASLERSLDYGVSEDAGIDGILSRLEKQRNSDFGINLAKIEHETLPTSKDNGYYGFDTPKDVARIDSGQNIDGMTNFHQKNTLNMSGRQISASTEPNSWKTWSYQRTGFQHTEFEAAEISVRKVRVEGRKETSYDGETLTNEKGAEALDGTIEIDHHQIRTRLQHLELELNTALSSLRSKREKNISEEAIGSSSEFRDLSDAWEFQENEFISAQEGLRSIRAKLAVLEGKMALAVIEAQKVADEKQKRIDGARKAFQLLRSTCIVWSNSASEVLLVGSFDGWTAQRKMEKSRSGVFTIYLKLYPGRYEIKFIVDGIWKVDPLRPIADNNGHKNNILIVT